MLTSFSFPVQKTRYFQQRIKELVSLRFFAILIVMIRFLTNEFKVSFILNVLIFGFQKSAEPKNLPSWLDSVIAIFFLHCFILFSSLAACCRVFQVDTPLHSPRKRCNSQEFVFLYKQKYRQRFFFSFSFIFRLFTISSIFFLFSLVSKR